MLSVLKVEIKIAILCNLGTAWQPAAMPTYYVQTTLLSDGEHYGALENLVAVGGGQAGQKQNGKLFRPRRGRRRGEDTEAFVAKLQLQPVAGLTLGLMCRYLSWVFTDTLIVAQVITSNCSML